MTRAVEVGGWEMVAGHMNERSLVTSLHLFDLAVACCYSQRVEVLCHGVRVG